jgi:hypothetical protein
LETLRLCGVRLTNVVAKAMADMLRVNSTLKVLDLEVFYNIVVLLL